MSDEAGSNPAAPAVPAGPTGLGDNKGIKFNITTGNKKWSCTLQDRSAYERKKTARQDSSDSVETKDSSSN